jgi:hypothetical protein
LQETSSSRTTKTNRQYEGEIRNRTLTEIKRSSWEFRLNEVPFDTLQAYFNQYPRDLVEVKFAGIVEAGWRKLFDWINPRINRLHSQHGVERGENERLELGPYQAEEYSYLAVFNICGVEGLSLLCNDLHYAETSFQQEHISTHEEWINILRAIEKIAILSECVALEIYMESNQEDMIHHFEYEGNRAKR